MGEVPNKSSRDPCNTGDESQCLGKWGREARHDSSGGELTLENVKRADTLEKKDSKGSGGLHILTISEAMMTKVGPCVCLCVLSQQKWVLKGDCCC